jgi:hypothetical protein
MSKFKYEGIIYPKKSKNKVKKSENSGKLKNSEEKKVEYPALQTEEIADYVVNETSAEPAESEIVLNAESESIEPSQENFDIPEKSEPTQAGKKRRGRQPKSRENNPDDSPSDDDIQKFFN